MAESPPSARGLLTTRPREPTERGGGAGLTSLAHGAELYVPPTYDPASPNALVLTLHGARAGPRSGFEQLLPLADEAGLILLGPQSQRESWDILCGGYGPDVVAIDELLDDVFRRYAIDPRRIFASGFSDGASYALSLGLTNGDVFAGLAAFSPGFAETHTRRGKPHVFISHGTDDRVIPIAPTSRRIVPRLRREGYDVTYREFTGPHIVPPEIAREAVEWLARGRT